jgi:hypothetical protein
MYIWKILEINLPVLPKNFGKFFPVLPPASQINKKDPGLDFL